MKVVFVKETPELGYILELCVCVCEGGGGGGGGSLNKKTFLERFGIILTHSPTTT